MQEDDFKVAHLDLEVDEFITSISGRSGDVIDYLKFTTNKERTVEAGGTGGNPFTLDIPENCIVGSISGGKNGHLHNIKVKSGPMPIVITSKAKVENKKSKNGKKT